MHFGLTFNCKFRCAENPYGVKTKDHEMNAQVKSDTCLALRLSQLIMLFITAALPWALILPIPLSSPFHLSEIPDYAEIKQRYFVKVLNIGGWKYDVI